MTAVAVTTSRPPPNPCTARQPISHVIPGASPHIAEAPTNRPAASWKTRLRPNWSPNFPASTVAIVFASRYDDTTHDRCSAPPRSPTIVGSAVETIVWSSAANSIPAATVREDQVHPPPVQRLRLARGHRFDDFPDCHEAPPG